jgi:hypothetical protein
VSFIGTFGFFPVTFTVVVYREIEQFGFTGTIPNILGALVQLQELALGNNALTGTIPARLAQLASITRL